MNMRADDQDMTGFMTPRDQYYTQVFGGYGSGLKPSGGYGNGLKPSGGYGSGMNLLNTNPINTPAAVHGIALSQLPAQTQGYDWLDPKNIFGKDGWGGMALGAAQGLFDGYLGLQKLGMAKKALAENQRQFNLNYDAQRRTTNAALADRQRARLASNPGAYQSEYDYMNQYGVK